MATPWFETLPLDFSRQEVRDVEELLTAAYPSHEEVKELAASAGLNTGKIDYSPKLSIYVRNALRYAHGAARLLRVLAEVIGDKDKAQYSAQLATYLQGYEAKLQAAILAYQPSLALLSRAVSGELRVGNKQPIRLAGFEKVINAAAGFADIAMFRRGLIEAEVRTARVLIDGKASGTGFLVGDSLLLTNWHVVRSVTDTAHAQFDYKTDDLGNVINEGRKIAFAAQWKLASSEYAPIPVEISADGPSEKTWDYALVRLVEPIGAQPIGDVATNGEVRGCCRLVGTGYAFDADEPLLIVGHPKATPMQLSYASPSGAALTKHSTRVRYQTNTEGGSSGSPVFNKNWQLVALHHASGPSSVSNADEITVDAFNQGIPIAEIVADLKAKLPMETRNELGIG